jgi:hypothetical protein
MFLLSWNLPQIKWGVLLSETGITIGKRLSKRFFGVQPNDGYTDAQVTQSADVVHQIKQCEPMGHNELDAGLISSICNKLKQGRELEARQAIQKAARPEAREWCIDALKTAATLICTCGPTVVKDATFNLLGCD